MDAVKERWKANAIQKAWKRIKSLGHASRSSAFAIKFQKSKSWHHPWRGECRDGGSDCLDSEEKATKTKKKDGEKNKGQPTTAPHGCFAVYVGPERTRFAVRTELASHPLFVMLLEDAESEYGYRSEGPITLPSCDVDLFYRVLAEMESKDDEDDDVATIPNCGLCSPYSGGAGGAPPGHMRRYGSYKVLRSPSPMATPGRRR